MTQQEKRIQNFQFIFKHLVLDNSEEIAMKDLFENSDIEGEFEKGAEYAFKNKEKIFKEITKHLKTGWSIERLAKTEQAILLAGFGERKTSEIDRKIIINEHVNISKRYGSSENTYKLINALLEKTL